MDFIQFINFKGFTPGGGQNRQSGQSGQTPPSSKPRKAVGTPTTRVLISLLITLVFGGVYYYVALPPFNLKSEDFYFFVILLTVVYMASILVLSGTQAVQGNVKDLFGELKRQCRVPLMIFAAVLAVCVVGWIVSSVVFRASSYSKLLTFETGDFAAEVTEVRYDQIPMLDKDSAQRLGDRKLGELSDMVSQFEVMDDYTQINYKGRPVRIATLTYADLIKWFTNRAQGLPAYLLIDMVTQNVELVRLEEGIKYTTVEHFGRNLYRHLRFNYPTFMFEDPVMEVDEDGVPYWICPRLVKTIGLFGGVDVNGAVMVNAITGECTYMEQVPNWVDNLYYAELIIQQYDYYGYYHNGFINSLLGQKDVTVTTQGYNYIAMDDDVYMYTGITSVGGDQSNIGFILSNQRTKETTYYPVAGATEYSAMDSAQGELQHLRYEATFPLLLNVGGEPTYFMAMKDAAQLVKQYAMVNVQQYNIVATGDTVMECESNYLELLLKHNVISDGDLGADSSLSVINGQVADIRSAVIDGNTVYYIRLESGPAYYTVSAAQSTAAIILSEGDRVSIRYWPGEGNILTIDELTIAGE